MGLLLLGEGVKLPTIHTTASLAKLCIGVRESAHRDALALANEARAMLRSAKSQDEEAVHHFRAFAADLRHRFAQR